LETKALSSSPSTTEKKKVHKEGRLLLAVAIRALYSLFCTCVDFIFAVITIKIIYNLTINII
jgi:hypothetical protein